MNCATLLHVISLIGHFLGRCATVLGIAICLAAFVVSGAWLFQSGWLNVLSPPPPVVRETVVAAPVYVELEGPTTCIRGETYVFLARASGAVGRPAWKVIPETTGALEPIGDDGLAVRFRSLDHGVFSLVVSVAGEGNQIANAHREFENVDLVTEEIIEQPLPTPAAMAEVAMPREPEPLPTVAELTAAAIDNVSSADRAAEARAIAGSFRSVIGRIETGLVAPNIDPVAEAERQAKAALGARADAWTVFFAAVHTIVDTLRQDGEITTAASAVPTLAEIAGVLQQAR